MSIKLRKGVVVELTADVPSGSLLSTRRWCPSWLSCGERGRVVAIDRGCIEPTTRLVVLELRGRGYVSVWPINADRLAANCRVIRRGRGK